MSGRQVAVKPANRTFALGHLDFIQHLDSHIMASHNMTMRSYTS
jgi:hypothetical protein